MKDIQYDHYFARLQETIRLQWNEPALCNFQGESMTFGQMAAQMARIHLLLQEAGVKKGDHIALCARNTYRWALSYLAITTYEAVAVPLLVDFHADSVMDLTDHSDALLLFTDREKWKSLDIARMPKLRGVICTEDFSIIHSDDRQLLQAHENVDRMFAQRYPDGFRPENVHYNTDNMDDLAIINYTSGSSGDPKGVMLTYRATSASIDFGQRHIPVRRDDSLVSMLPMAHIYGLTFELLYPITGGCTVYYLGGRPAPSKLLQAMKEVRPYQVITVPLVMEKVYRSSIEPVLGKWYMRVLCAIPGIGSIIYGKVREKLQAAFGGKVRNFIMGGAPLNPTVERCFRRMKLNFTVGYGMTEAAPLLAYEDWRRFALRSCGKAVDRADVRIDSSDPATIVGEIQAKGDNICLGYYKNETATQAAFTDDGYLHTGDLGLMDKEGNIYIKGRSKCMILSANGQNIYPEEIEAILTNREYVAESLVVEREGGKIVALVYFDPDRLKNEGIRDSDMPELERHLLRDVNKHLPAYSQIHHIERRTTPFEKTPKMSIKRYLYK